MLIKQHSVFRHRFCEKCGGQRDYRLIYIREYIKTDVREQNKKYLNKHGQWGTKSKFKNKWISIGYQCLYCKSLWLNEEKKQSS